MERYIQELLAQIRCKQAHELVRREIQTHIEEQICENMVDGMEREEAVEAAIRDMGDPVETGVELDKIHRPRIEWKLILAVAFISLCSVAIRYFVARDCQAYNSYSLLEDVLTVGMGLALMGIIYRLDYSVIGYYAKAIDRCGILYWFSYNNFFCNGSERLQNVYASGNGHIFPNFAIVFVCTGLWSNFISVPKMWKNRTLAIYSVDCDSGMSGIFSIEWKSGGCNGSDIIDSAFDCSVEKLVSGIEKEIFDLLLDDSSSPSVTCSGTFCKRSVLGKEFSYGDTDLCGIFLGKNICDTRINGEDSFRKRMDRKNESGEFKTASICDSCTYLGVDYGILRKFGSSFGCGIIDFVDREDILGFQASEESAR